MKSSETVASALSGVKIAGTARQITWQQPTDANGQPHEHASLTYDTGPFRDGATLSGPMTTTLSASSDNTNLELIPTLYDVAPDGSTRSVTTGTVLGSQRAYDPARSMYEHGVLVHPLLDQSGYDYSPLRAEHRVVGAPTPRALPLLQDRRERDHAHEQRRGGTARLGQPSCRRR